MSTTCMSDNLQNLDGVGPAREERLNDEGFETYTDLGEADPEALSASIQRLPEDTALELVVQAQNMADLEEADVETTDVGEAADDGVSESEFDLAEETDEDPAEMEPETDEVEEAVDETDPTVTVSFSFDSEYEYDTFYQTLLEERCRLNRTNRAGADLYEKMLDQMRSSTVDEEFSVEMEEGELNDMHNAILQQRISYQGENLIDYMDALVQVEAKVNTIREEELF